MLSDLEIAPIDSVLANQVQEAIDIKTKPPGSLGQIEAAALSLALAQGRADPAVDPAQLVIFAGDHGIVAEGVSAWPQAVTAQMVLNFLGGGAAANVFARTNGVELTVADAGVASDMLDGVELPRAGIRLGTRNAAVEDALAADEVSKALRFGADLAIAKQVRGTRVLLLGEMGIGNTATAALLAHSVAGLDLDILTGPGAGLDPSGVARKREILARSARRRPVTGPEDALAAFGGLEIACMVGAIIGAASVRMPVLVDGFIATSAALVALAARPEAKPYAIFAHRSLEPGHRLMLDALDVRPLLDLDLRLGEGTGALLAFPLLRAACAMLSDMATFESAGVSERG